MDTGLFIAGLCGLAVVFLVIPFLLGIVVIGERQVGSTAHKRWWPDRRVASSRMERR